MGQHILTKKDFEEVLSEKLSENINKLIASSDFRYRELTDKERDQCLLEIMRRLLRNDVITAGPHRLDQWETGWGENLEALQKTEAGALTPRYFGKFSTLRWKQRFIKPLTKNFEERTLAIIQEWLFEKYLSGAKAIYEFGCGTGHHLLNAHRINKFAPLFGLDWATSSQEIISELGKRDPSLKISGHRFDFFNPDYSVKFAPFTR